MFVYYGNRDKKNDHESKKWSDSWAFFVTWRIRPLKVIASFFMSDPNTCNAFALLSLRRYHHHSLLLFILSGIFWYWKWTEKKHHCLDLGLCKRSRSYRDSSNKACKSFMRENRSNYIPICDIPPSSVLLLKDGIIHITSRNLLLGSNRQETNWCSKRNFCLLIQHSNSRVTAK